MIDNSKLSEGNDKSFAYSKRHARKTISVGKRKNIVKCKEALTIVILGNLGNKKRQAMLGDINLETQMANSIFEDCNCYLLKNVCVYLVIKENKRSRSK
jgi:hypothetical protein